LFFWDIETFSDVPDQFPRANNPADYIFMISIITSDGSTSNGYVIVNGTVDPSTINTYGGALTLIRVRNEKELLMQFLSIHSMFDPDKQIYFNGDSFDMPYLLTRFEVNNIKLPAITRIAGAPPYITTRKFFTPYGSSFEKTLTLPGVEIIDLLHYYRRFYPFFLNHRLDTVARSLLQVGKTDLSIDDMMDAVRTRDPQKMIRVVDYSYIDSLRMEELWNYSDIYTTTEIVCNNLGINNDMLLRDEISNIINRAAFHVDPGAAMISGENNAPAHLREAIPGIYRNVQVYDYANVYRNIMKYHGNSLIQNLARRLKYAPPAVISSAFYSKYANQDVLVPILQDTLNKLVEEGGIISIELSAIRTTFPIDDPRFKLVEEIPSFVAISKASYIVISVHNEMETYGISKLCRPPFPLARDFVQTYLVNVYRGRQNSVQLPDIREVELERLTLNTKIKDISSLSPKSDKYKLAQQYRSPIPSDGITVKYIMSKRGPVLLSMFRSDDKVDAKYYNDILSTMSKNLRTLKIYDFIM